MAFITLRLESDSWGALIRRQITLEVKDIEQARARVLGLITRTYGQAAQPPTMVIALGPLVTVVSNSISVPNKDELFEQMQAAACDTLTVNP